MPPKQTKRGVNGWRGGEMPVFYGEPYESKQNNFNNSASRLKLDTDLPFNCNSFKEVHLRIFLAIKI